MAWRTIDFCTPGRLSLSRDSKRHYTKSDLSSSAKGAFPATTAPPLPQYQHRGSFKFCGYWASCGSLGHLESFIYISVVFCYARTIKDGTFILQIRKTRTVVTKFRGKSQIWVLELLVEYEGNLSMDKDIRYWMDLSSYDFETAEAMLESGRYLYVLFCCQQSIEKRLKGLVTKNTGQLTPKTHDLLRLVGVARIDISDERELFLRKLTNYYIPTRYPEEVADLMTQVNRQLAERYLISTKETLEWLDRLIK